MTAVQRHWISMIVNDRVGVLVSIAESFAEKGINIASFAADEVQEGTARLTIVVKCPQDDLADVVAHLRSLPDILSVDDLDAGHLIERQLMLVRVRAEPEDIARIMQYVEVFRATIAGMEEKSLTIEMSGIEDKVDAFANLLRPFGILQIARTGRVAIERNGACKSDK